VVLAVVGVVIAAGIPYFLRYVRTATLNAGVQEVRDALARAKQLAISTRQCICVEVTSSTTYRYRQGTTAIPCAASACTGTAWKGVGTDANGYLSLQNRVRISNSGSSPIFTVLGTAPPGPAVFTVTAPSGATRTVTVTGAGRITSP
jgi:Tfp pilus assembly protein FimT